MERILNTRDERFYRYENKILQREIFLIETQYNPQTQKQQEIETETKINLKFRNNRKTETETTRTT
jgi:hypothetical protein